MMLRSANPDTLANAQMDVNAAIAFTGNLLSEDYSPGFDDTLPLISNRCCIGPQCEASACVLPWGGTLDNGDSITAYLSSTASTPSETRTCTGTTLSGSYPYPTFNPNPPCTSPWGGTSVASGGSITAYQSASVPYGSACQSQQRICTSGTFTGSYTQSACTVQPANNCNAPWGGLINHLLGIVAYQTATVSFGHICIFQIRTCTNGTLSGNYQYQSCNVLGL